MRRRKQKFVKAKMFSSRVEEVDFEKFERLLKYRDGTNLQDFVNLVVVSYISGTIALSGSQIVVGPAASGSV